MASLYLVRDYRHSGIIEVQPGWNLPVGDNKNVPNPRCMPLDRSQRVPQLFIIFKTAGRDIFILLRLRKAWGTEREKIPLSHTAPPTVPSVLRELQQTFKDCIQLLNLKKKAKHSAYLKQQQKNSISFNIPFKRKGSWL